MTPRARSRRAWGSSSRRRRASRRRAAPDAATTSGRGTFLAAVRGLPPKGLAIVAGALLLLSGRRRRGRIARFLVPLGAASFVVALRRGWAPAALGAR